MVVNTVERLLKNVQLSAVVVVTTNLPVEYTEIYIKLIEC